MSLPPYNHTRNLALEKEDEYQEYPAPSVPLITHSGVIEKWKTTDRNLIRSRPPHSGVEFEYLPVFSSSGSTMRCSKSNPSKMKKVEKPAANEEKDGNKNCCSHVHNDEIKIDNLGINDEELNNKMPSENENNENVNETAKRKYSESICSDKSSSKHSERSVRKNREASAKSNVSNESLCSRRSAKSAVSESSVTSTIKNVINDKENHRRALSPLGFRRIANGLDEGDLFPSRRR